MRAAREALLILVVAFCIIFPCTPGGCYFLYNLKDGHGDLPVVKQYLQDRGIVVLDDSLSRRNLGTTKNCEAKFKTDVTVFKALVANPKSPFVEDSMEPLQAKAFKRIPEAKRPAALQELLKIPVYLTDSEREDFVRAYLVDNLLIYREDKKTLPGGWAYARLFVSKTDGRAYLYYARS